MKANQIIRKLQEQLKQEQNKANLRGKIAGEQVTQIIKIYRIKFYWVIHKERSIWKPLNLS